MPSTFKRAKDIEIVFVFYLNVHSQIVSCVLIFAKYVTAKRWSSTEAVLGGSSKVALPNCTSSIGKETRSPNGFRPCTTFSNSNTLLLIPSPVFTWWCDKGQTVSAHTVQMHSRRGTLRLEDADLLSGLLKNLPVISSGEMYCPYYPGI